MHATRCLAGVPIVIFHGVGERDADELTLAVDVFEQLARWLARRGFRTLRCAELVDHLERGSTPAGRCVVLTFDDAYLDNWTHAHDILARHDLRATLFAPTARIQEGETRPRRDEGGAAGAEHTRWSELRAMAESGVFEVQSHGAAHAFHFAGPRIVDFVHPGLTPTTSSLLRDLVEADGLRLGAPLYETSPEIARPRYRPDPDLAAVLCARVEAGGGALFFEREAWRAELREDAERWSAGRPDTGELEPEAELHDRARRDLMNSRAALSEHGFDPAFLAWPAGRSSPELCRLALDVGFRATFGTERVPATEAWPQRLVPRTYWGQEYRGRLQDGLRRLKFAGVVEAERGAARGFAQIFLANRGMRLLGSAGA